MGCKKIVSYSCIFILILIISCGKKIPTQPDSIEIGSRATDALGQAPIIFHITGRSILITVMDENNQPLNNIEVEGWLIGSKYMIIAYDQSGNYFPNIKIDTLDPQADNRLDIILKAINMAIAPRDLTEAVIELEVNRDEILEFINPIPQPCFDIDKLSSYYDNSWKFTHFLLVSAPLFTNMPRVYAVVPRLLSLGQMEKDFIHLFFPEGNAFKEFTTTSPNSFVYVEPLELCEPQISYFHGSPVKIKKGASSTLGWNTQNAAEVSIEPGIGKVKSDGQMLVYPTETTTYTLRAKNLTKEQSETTTVTVTDGS